MLKCNFNVKTYYEFFTYLYHVTIPWTYLVFVDKNSFLNHKYGSPDTQPADLAQQPWHNS